MQRYIINANAQRTKNSEHEVHKLSTCKTENLPDIKNRISLGECENCMEAIKKAKRQYPFWVIDGCKHCIPLCHKI